MKRAAAARLALGAVVLAGLLAAPSASALRFERFKVTIRGTQVTTWSYDKARDAGDPCSSTQHADGDQQIRFRSRVPSRMQVYRPSRYTRGRPLITFLPTGELTAGAELERNGEWRTADDWDRAHCIPAGDGSPGDYQPPHNDCGTRYGDLGFRLFYTELGGTDLVPLTRERDRLKVVGESSNWSTRESEGSSNSGRDLETLFSECPWWIGGPNAEGERAGGTLLVVVPLRERTLYNRERKRIVLDGSRIKRYKAANFTGKTIMTFKIVLRRY